jgi:1,4-dihydroxy-6-naphthoate synthase
MRKEFSDAQKADIDLLIRDSLAYAEAYYPDLSDYVVRHSQEMQESVIRQHIDLYVNQFSLSLGEEGRRAVDVLMKVYEESVKVW